MASDTALSLLVQVGEDNGTTRVECGDDGCVVQLPLPLAGLGDSTTVEHLLRRLVVPHHHLVRGLSITECMNATPQLRDELREVLSLIAGDVVVAEEVVTLVYAVSPRLSSRLAIEELDEALQLREGGVRKLDRLRR